MTQAKLYPSGELKAHPPLRTLDEAMRERVTRLIETLWSPASGCHCDRCSEVRAVLALLKD